MSWRYARVQGVLVEPLGQIWAAFSPASGDTVLVNDECAAVLEVLLLEPGDTERVCSALAADNQLDGPSLQTMVESSWPRLIEAGLVQVQSTGTRGAK